MVTNRVTERPGSMFPGDMVTEIAGVQVTFEELGCAFRQLCENEERRNAAKYGGRALGRWMLLARLMRSLFEPVEDWTANPTAGEWAIGLLLKWWAGKRWVRN